MLQKMREKIWQVLAQPVSSRKDLHEKIAQRAYQRDDGGGCVNGNDRDYWLQAERETQTQRPSA